MACPSASRTSTPPEAQQPVPAQTVIQGLDGSRPARIRSRHASSSNTATDLPLAIGGSLLFPVFVQYPPHLASCHIPVVLPVDHHHRPQGAAPQAVHRFQGEQLILGGPAGIDIEQLPNLVDQAVSTAH